jgi:hypothetical protein
MNARSSNRNRNAAANRNNNIGFRPASTLRRTRGSVEPESVGPLVLRSVPWCKVQAAARCRAACVRPAKGSEGPAGLVGRTARRPRRAVLSGELASISTATAIAALRLCVGVRTPRRGQSPGGYFTTPAQVLRTARRCRRTLDVLQQP